MSEDSTDSNNEGSSSTTTTSHTRKTKKENEFFGVPKDDLTLGIAGAAALGVAGLIIKTGWDMMQNGQLPNPFAPPTPRISYSDVQAQQDWEQQQRQAQQPAVQQQPEPQQPVGGDPNAQTMPAYEGFDDVEDGVSYSTTPPKRTSNRFDRINGG